MSAAELWDGLAGLVLDVCATALYVMGLSEFQCLSVPFLFQSWFKVKLFFIAAGPNFMISIKFVSGEARSLVQVSTQNITNAKADCKLKFVSLN